MFSESDILSVFNFMKDTPEGPLRKMLVGGEMTDAHFRLLLKVVRGCGAPEFVEAFNSESIPKVRLTPAEYPLKETMWPVCKKKLQSIGLLNATAAKAA
jgi:hypothetical protein